MARGLDWEKAASQQLVRERGGDPIGPDRTPRHEKQLKVVEWRWVALKDSAQCVACLKKLRPPLRKKVARHRGGQVMCSRCAVKRQLSVRSQ